MKEHVQDAIAKVQAIAENWSAEEVLRWAFDRFGNNVAISSAFGVEGMAVIDIASRVNPGFRLFSIDTDFLFPETYNLIDEIEARYQVKIEKVYSLLSPEEQEQQYGTALWARNPDMCCNLRKVEPLRRGAERQLDTGRVAAPSALRAACAGARESGCDRGRRDLRNRRADLPLHRAAQLRRPRSPAYTRTVVGRSQAVRQRVLVPRSQVRILAPQPSR